MKINKKITYSVITLGILGILFFGISLLIFINNTVSRNDVLQYCVNNSTTSSTSFVRYEPISDPIYAMWIAENNDENISQELFIFKKAKYLFFTIDSRFNYVYTATSSSNEIVGSVKFMPLDENNNKKTSNLLVFFSSNNKNITHYYIEYEENGDFCTRKGSVSTEQAFIVCIPNLGIVNGITRKFIKIEFYDNLGNLVTDKES